tara:strand:- start:6133 stop:6240 length:108 start_codon:yes stop_codon:yes gene_type:complete
MSAGLQKKKKVQVMLETMLAANAIMCLLVKMMGGV